MAYTEREYWVFIDKTKMDSDLEAVKLFGSVKALLRENLTIDGKVLTERQLRYRLHNKYWNSDKYLIKKCLLHREKRE